MTRRELIGRMTQAYETGFVETVAAAVIQSESLEVIYELATTPDSSLPTAERHKVVFRSCWVLDYIFQTQPAQFQPFEQAFFTTDYVRCADTSAKRLFCKMMNKLLSRRQLSDSMLEPIAEATASWVVESDATVSLRVWAVEVLAQCRGRFGWVDEMWPDLMALLHNEATSGLVAHFRKRWK